MSGIEVLDQLIAAARLPEVVSTEPVDEHGDGLDNLLTKATLADGREVLLRESRLQEVAPTLRAKFLEACGVGAPHLYAANDRGAMLVDFVPGRQLSEMLATDTVSDRTWELTGAAFARVHAVRFPAPLQGLVGPASVVLEPVDPVDQLMAALEGARPWLAQHQSQVLPVVDQLRSFIVRRADNIRAEVPCLIHGDANLLNIIVEEQVTLIDWDFPAVRYPLAELSALDEHVYLTAGVGLPPAFFAGYGHAVPADLLLAYRMVGCLRWLSSAEWKRWEVDRAMPASARRRLGRWHERLLEWVGGIPALAQDLQC